MDRSWMNAKRFTPEYRDGVKAFLEYAEKNTPNHKGLFLCPCNKCLNCSRLDSLQVKSHLICNGFMQNYKVWIWHGEDVQLAKETQPGTSRPSPSNVEMPEKDDYLEEMINDLGEEAFVRQVVDRTADIDKDTPLYPGTSVKRAVAVLKLINVKAKNGWTDKSFTELLEVLKTLLPPDNTLPERNYDAKKLLCPMGLDVEKIHACPNDCILYRNEYAHYSRCPK